MEKDKLLAFVDGLIKEGNDLLKTVYQGITIEGPGENWFPRILTLFQLLGRRARPWAFAVARRPTDHLTGTTKDLIGVLAAIREAIESGMLVEIEDVVLADTFRDLLAQADHLHSQRYDLAAGVLGRAVLEEHLHKWCERMSCLPSGRPTINDLNMELYRGSHIKKLEMHSVTAMATAGNHCAHNTQPPLSSVEVEKMLADVRDFIARHPLP